MLEADARRRGLRNEEQVRFLHQRAQRPGDLATLLTSALDRDSIVTLDALRPRLRFSDEEVDRTIDQLIANQVATRIDRNIASAAWWDALLDRARDLVGAYHKKNADLPGLPLADLRQALASRLPEEGLFDLVLQHLEDRDIVQRGTILAERSFSPSLPDDIRSAAEALERSLSADPLNPPGKAELATDPASRRALSFLVRSGTAVELTDKVVILSSTYQEAADKIVAHLQGGGGGPPATCASSWGPAGA